MDIKKVICIFFFFNLFFSELLARDFIIIQSTTSTKDSGLLEILEKKFEDQFQIDVRFVSSGTEQAIINTKKGNGDLLMVHSKEDEKKFINDGYGIKRFEFMYNDFIIIGPKHNPAQLKNTNNIIQIMNKIKSSKALFLSRDDNSGTYKKEISLWEKAGIAITKKDKWYLSNGLGMGHTLNMASELDAHTLVDRATWLFFNNKNYLSILFENNESLYNPYSLIPINPEIFPHTEYEKSMIFINWIMSSEGKSIINDYKINNQQLFFTY